MKSVPQHLHSEDRQEYERILDEALRSAPHRPELAAVGQRLNPEQLRTMALNATALITAAAATEYQHYVKVREELRHPAPLTAPPVREPGSKKPIPTTVGLSRRLGASVLGVEHRRTQATGRARQRQRRVPFGRRLLASFLGVRTRPAIAQVPGSGTTRQQGARPAGASASAGRATMSQAHGTNTGGLAASIGEVSEVAETGGAGCLAVAAVLAPILTGAAAAIFLLVGYVLKMLDPAPVFAQTMLTTGWILCAVMATSVLVGAAGLVITALRNGPSFDTEPHGELSGEVARAREAWREALLERGILPFLREALADPGAALPRTAPPAPTGRMPHLGYNRPGFKGSDGSPRPSYTSPDYTSPDFGGPEHQPE
ncbi:hypothetical protein ACFYZ5_40455 [Streptomyces chartreusis]|uniref:hypothetical protein n=1 Tax=Streptomyces chartreusis TaxID=1969 RepID=UPI0036826DF3